MKKIFLLIWQLLRWAVKKLHTTITYHGQSLTFILTHFMPPTSSQTSWKHQKTFGYRGYRKRPVTWNATIRIQQLSSKRNRKAKVQIFNVVWFFDPFPYYCLIDTWLLNPFLANVSILYPLKTPENLWFSGVFRG